MAWRTITNGLIMTWIAINTVILLNSPSLYELKSLEGLAGHLTGFVVITLVGSLVLYYVGNKFIAIRKKNYAKRYADKATSSDSQK